MNEDITFREIKTAEEAKACQIMMDSFSEFVRLTTVKKM